MNDFVQITNASDDNKLIGFVAYSDIDETDCYCSICGEGFVTPLDNSGEPTQIQDDSQILYCCNGEFYEPTCKTNYHVHKKCIVNVIKPKSCSCPLREYIYYTGRKSSISP